MAVQLVLDLLAGEAAARQVQQEEVIVRAAGDHLVAHVQEGPAHGGGVAHHLVDVRPEFLRARLLVNFSGRLYNCVFYDVDAAGLIDYADVRAKALAHRPRLILAGASAYSRRIDFAAFADIARVIPRRHQARDVGHVHHEIRPRLLRGGGKAGKVAACR